VMQPAEPSDRRRWSLLQPNLARGLVLFGSDNASSSSRVQPALPYMPRLSLLQPADALDLGLSFFTFFSSRREPPAMHEVSPKTTNTTETEDTGR
jgi:hypothetical protein